MQQGAPTPDDKTRNWAAIIGLSTAVIGLIAAVIGLIAVTINKWHDFFPPTPIEITLDDTSDSKPDVIDAFEVREKAPKQTDQYLNKAFTKAKQPIKECDGSMHDNWQCPY